MGSPALTSVPRSALFDSNILIDLLFDKGSARAAVEACPGRAISVITSIELLAGVPESGRIDILDLLERFDELPLDRDVRDEAARIRRSTRLKLPDAIILATARIHRLPLVTRNTRDFPAGDQGVVVPYSLT